MTGTEEAKHITLAGQPFELVLPTRIINDHIERMAGEILQNHAPDQLVIAMVAMGGVALGTGLSWAMANLDPEAAAQVGWHIEDMSSRSVGSASAILHPQSRGRHNGILAGKDVLIVDAAIGTGRAASVLVRRLQHRETLSGAASEPPASVDIAALVRKPTRLVESLGLSLRYIGFDLPDGTYIGRGMNLVGTERGRSLTGIYRLTNADQAA